uniref:Uncharacterized protein n=1 Tax=Glossina austeni TaxID=7395 RepID=A0A1A9UD10_GLOAU
MRLLVFVERKTHKKKLGGTATQTNCAGIDEYAIPAPWYVLNKLKYNLISIFWIRLGLTGECFSLIIASALVILMGTISCGCTLPVFDFRVQRYFLHSSNIHYYYKMVVIPDTLLSELWQSYPELWGVKQGLINWTVLGRSLADELTKRTGTLTTVQDSERKEIGQVGGESLREFVHVCVVRAQIRTDERIGQDDFTNAIARRSAVEEDLGEVPVEEDFGEVPVEEDLGEVPVEENLGEVPVKALVCDRCPENRKALRNCGEYRMEHGEYVHIERADDKYIVVQMCDLEV